MLKLDEHTSFQCACGPLTLCGDIDPMCIIDPTCPPSNIIPSCTDFLVRVKWEIYGTIVPMMGGEFKVTVGFDAVGDGPNANYSASVSVASGKYSHSPTEGPERDFVVDVRIPNASDKLIVGVYLLSAYVTYTDVNGRPGPIAGMSAEKFLEIFPQPNE